jgi:two-component system chemotaxis response regulator CheB
VKPDETPGIVVVGASAGGVPALETLVSALPAGLDAAIFVVLHLWAHAESLLPHILSRAGSLPAVHPKDRDVVETGRIYAAPPDRHLLLTDSMMRVVRGPRENMHRPAIDVLFRSAAMTYGPRVIGVLLTGADDDGAAGLKIIKERGGIAVVQDPADSAHPQMPESALRAAGPDFVLPLREIGRVVCDLVSGAIQLPERATVPEEPTDEVFKKGERGERVDISLLGAPSAFSCPDCNGTLWELQDGDVVSYRCRVGHGFSAGSMAEAQNSAVERALWEAVRVLDESASTSRRIARKSESLRERLLEKAEEHERCADVIRKLLQNNG